MNPLPSDKWGGVTTLTWGEISQYQWGDFRTALFEVITEGSSTAIAIENIGATSITDTILKTQGVNVEHSPIINTTFTDMIVNIVVSDRDYYSNMVNCLPLYERKSRMFNDILLSYDYEFRTLEQRLVVTERNLYIDTAVESLPIHERDLNIRILPHLTYDQRREQIESRYRAAFDQTTEETIKEVAAAYSNGEVEVNETATVGIYEIKFTGKGVPDNIEGLRQVLEVIMPAHLGFEFAYTYATWRELSQYKWDDVSDETWSTIQEWEGKK